MENEGTNVNDKKRYLVFIYRNGGDGKDASGFYYWTGIGIRKYYHPEDWSEHASENLNLLSVMRMYCLLMQKHSMN